MDSPPSENDWTRRKERWAEKMRARGFGQGRPRSADRLPPGQHVVEKLPVLDLGIHPQVPLSEWRLEICGAAEAPFSLGWEDLLALPQIEDVSDFHCVTTWSKYECRWGGVALSEIVDRARPRADAEFVFFTCYDGYTTNVRTAHLLDAGALLAHRLGGLPLALSHGGPLRAVLPKLYAWKSPKFLRRIEFRALDEPGYWERRGYSTTADPWEDDRFATDRGSDREDPAL